MSPIQRHAVVQINCVGLDIYVQERYGLYTMLWHCYFFSYLSLAFHYLCNNNGFQVMYAEDRWHFLDHNNGLDLHHFSSTCTSYMLCTLRIGLLSWHHICMAMDGDESNQHVLWIRTLQHYFFLGFSTLYFFFLVNRILWS